MTKLDEIVAYKKIELAGAKGKRPLQELEKRLRDRPPVRDFRKAIHRSSISLIAEVKRSSPSAGAIRQGADAVSVAKAYAQAGAQGISVLTDSKFFSGSLDDLIAVRQAVPVPVLRKDFIIEEYQVIEAAAAGADAFLLIAAVLESSVLKRLIRLGRDLNLTPLVEVHTEKELGLTLDAGAQVVGINNRDLATFTVDLGTTRKLIGNIPADRTAVSESGIKSRADVQLVEKLGAKAVLVGEELMRAPDIGAKVKELMGA